jgi:hypothetical protein
VLSLAPGQIAGLTGIPGSGLTRIGMSLLAPHAIRGPLVYLDVRGWASPMAAWEMGIDPKQFVVVRSSDIVSWSRIVATLLEGVCGVYAEVPKGLKDQSLYKLAAKARTTGTASHCRQAARRSGAPQSRIQQGSVGGHRSWSRQSDKPSHLSRCIREGHQGHGANNRNRGQWNERFACGIPHGRSDSLA